MHCKNCNTSFDDQSGYCNNCGAKVIRNRLTIKNLFEHFSEQFLNYDNKFLQTFITLISRPEQVIGGYIKGTRKKNINPISFFAIGITVAGMQMFIISKFFPEGLDISTLAQKGQEEFFNNWMRTVMEYQSLEFMLYIPFFAIMSKIVFYNLKTYNYTEHLVIFLYLNSQVTLILFTPTLLLIVSGFTLGDLTTFFLIFQIVYISYCFKRLFALGNKGLILKVLFFLVVLIIFFILFIVIFLAALILLQPEGFKELIEAENAARGSG